MFSSGSLTVNGYVDGTANEAVLGKMEFSMARVRRRNRQNISHSQSSPITSGRERLLYKAVLGAVLHLIFSIFKLSQDPTDPPKPLNHLKISYKIII